MSAQPAIADQTSRLELFLLSAAIWAMCLVTFSMPGRVGPGESGGLDIVALAKLAVRGGVLLFFLLAWRQHTEFRRKRYILWSYFPFLCFLVWAFLSVTWSPLKSVSIGQAIGLASLIALSAWIAMSCRTRAHVLLVVNQLWLALLAYSLILLAIHVVRPDVSGLDRSLQIRGANGMVHPTYAAATSSLGFLLTLLRPKLQQTFESKFSLLIGLAVHGTLLFLSNSRTGLTMTMLVSTIIFFRFYPKRLHALFLLGAAGLACLYLLVDPGFTLQNQSLRGSTEYLTRGQSTKQLTHLSGRLEMWKAVWEQFEKSPLIGHGYFVTSENGKLDVWERRTNHTAHNLVLQVLVSTGLVGAMIFLAAFWRVGSVIGRLRWENATARGVLVLIVLISLWYLGWCQSCISFIGPVLPESVVFFLLIGLGIGQGAQSLLSETRSVEALAT